MEIKLNHKIEKIDTQKSSITVEELLAIKNFTFELIIVRVNGALVMKENYSNQLIAPGNEVQVIHVFGGG